MKAKEQSQGKDFKHIVRIAKTDVDGNKKIKYALLKIKGVGVNFAHMICNLTDVDINKKAGYLEGQEIKKLDEAFADPSKIGAPDWMFNRQKDPQNGFTKHFLMADLEFAVQNDLKLLKMIKCYRGVRHMKRLPVRGQRTRSNFRKNKGKVMGVQKKKGK